MTTDFQPVEMIQGDICSGMLLIADHAMRNLPPEYGRLGLPEHEFDRHIAYDIGVEGVTRNLAALCGAPAIMARYSRLLIDPNRSEDDPTLVRQIYDGAVISGNYPLYRPELDRRIELYYRPFRAAVEAAAKAIEHAAASACIIISIHSFTPSMGGRARPWHIGLLWDRDDRVFSRLCESLKRDPQLIVGDNEPYDGALKGDTLHEHATKAGRAHVLIEIRQDLIASGQGQIEWARRLAPLLAAINDDPAMHEHRHFGSRTD
ncbi:MAG: N-formylglutamate amidohydrolase [Rhizobiaceae bacterium]